MRVVFGGVRGSCPAPGLAFARYGGNTSCVGLARDGGPVSLVLDAGTGLRAVSDDLGDAPFVGDVLLTHLHWDHVMGLPFFRAADRADARTTVHVPAADDATAHELIDRLLSPPYFPTGVRGLEGEWCIRSIGAGPCRLGDWDVVGGWLPHGREASLGYRVGDGSRSVAYVTDHGPAALDRYDPEVLALVRGCDVLIHDAQHLASEWAAVRHFGHAPHEYAIGLAEAAGAGTVVLFHHAPSRTDDQLDDLAARLPAGVRLAREGETLAV